MKRLLFLILALFLVLGQVQIGFADWEVSDPLGTDSPSDLDTIIPDNNACLQRVLYNYRQNCMVIPNTSSAITVLSGEIDIPNAAGSIIKMRRNTTSTAVDWTLLDTGLEAPSTQYYVYCVADNAAATTFTVKISASATAPAGATYYRKIGYFYNNASSNIVNVGNIKEGDVGNIVEVEGTSDISTSSTTMVDMTDMEIKFVSNGRPVFVCFSAPLYIADGIIYAEIEIDGTTYSTSYHQHHDGSTGSEITVVPFSIQCTATGLTAGTHTIKIQWKVAAGTGYQKGTIGERVLTASEL